jgi:ferric-dicitrate binding protein FerR (iron transport regulator)
MDDATQFVIRALEMMEEARTRTAVAAREMEAAARRSTEAGEHALRILEAVERAEARPPKVAQAPPPPPPPSQARPMLMGMALALALFLSGSFVTAAGIAASTGLPVFGIWLKAFGG